MTKEEFIYKPSLADAGKSINVRFLPNVDDPNNLMGVIYKVYRDGYNIMPSQQFLSFALIDNKYYLFRYGQSVKKWIDYATRGYYRHPITKEPFGNDLGFDITLWEELNELKLEFVDPIRPFVFDLKSKHSLKIDISNMHGFVKLNCEWIEDDKNQVFNGDELTKPEIFKMLQNKPYTLKEAVDELTDLIEEYNEAKKKYWNSRLKTT